MDDVAQKYAKALMKTQIDVSAIKQCIVVLDENPQLLNTLKSPIVRKKEKYNVIQRIFEGRVAGFLKLLCDNDRIGMISNICAAYEYMVLKQENAVCAELFYAFLPTEDEIAKIKNVVIKKYNKTDVILKLHEDKSLIGGFILKMGDTVYDRSIRGSVEALKRSVTPF